MKSLVNLLILSMIIAGCERPTETSDGNEQFPPAVPQGLSVYYASDGEVGIEWNVDRSASLKGYNVYRSIDDSVYNILDFSSRFYYFDDSLSYDSVYYYKVSALNYSGIESGLSGTVSARPVNRLAPDSPEGVLINARNWPESRSIYLEWYPNQETDVAGYNIYRSELQGFQADSASRLAYTADFEFNDTSITQLYKIHYYKVTAIDKGGKESSPSAERSDQLLGEPILIHPAMNSRVQNFREFIFLGSGAPARYKLIVQTGPFFGEVWQTDITPGGMNDTIKVDVPRGVFYYDTPYYWRAASYTQSDQPNSISQLNKFMITR